jgi:hypothetical protein
MFKKLEIFYRGIILNGIPFLEKSGIDNSEILKMTLQKAAVSPFLILILEASVV